MPGTGATTSKGISAHSSNFVCPCSIHDLDDVGLQMYCHYSAWKSPCGPPRCTGSKNFALCWTLFWRTCELFSCGGRSSSVSATIDAPIHLHRSLSLSLCLSLSLSPSPSLSFFPDKIYIYMCVCGRYVYTCMYTQTHFCIWSCVCVCLGSEYFFVCPSARRS